MERETLVVGVFALIIGVLIGVFVVPEFTGDVVKSCPEYECKYTDINAQYGSIGNTECIEKKGFFGIKDKCTIQIRNIEEQPAEFTPVFKCFTIVNSENPEIKKALKQALGPDEIGTFTITYDSNGRDWKCVLDSVESSRIQGCYLSIK